LKKLPIITKELLRKNIKDVCTISKNQAIEGHTGGTTGKSLVVYFTQKGMQCRMAMLDYFKEKNGFVNIKMKRATFSGKHIIPPNSKDKVFWRDNLSIKQRFYSSFHITEENLHYYIENLNKYKPVSIDGFFSSIYEVASYIKRNNISVLFHPVAIFPTAETVTEREKAVIEDVFNCPVRNQYASSEGAPFITECQCGSLHYEVLSGIFEYFEEGSNEVLVTSFTTYGTPLIRYRIGDSILFENPGVICECGVQTPLVKEVSGRMVDFLYTTSGAKINLGNIANVFKNAPNSIIKSQIIQDLLNHLIVKIVVDNNFNEKHPKMIIDEIKHKFGQDMNVEIEIVDDIPREKSGKYKLIVNNITRDRIANEKISY